MTDASYLVHTSATTVNGIQLVSNRKINTVQYSDYHRMNCKLWHTNWTLLQINLKWRSVPPGNLWQ